jgi:hypothetical protein
MDEHERRSRLVTLAYEVLRDLKTPTDEATNMAICSDLSRAFFDKAAALGILEVAAAPPPRRKAPLRMFSVPKA